MSQKRVRITPSEDGGKGLNWAVAAGSALIRILVWVYPHRSAKEQIEVSAAKELFHE